MLQLKHYLEFQTRLPESFPHEVGRVVSTSRQPFMKYTISRNFNKKPKNIFLWWHFLNLSILNIENVHLDHSFRVLWHLNCLNLHTWPSRHVRAPSILYQNPFSALCAPPVPHYSPYITINPSSATCTRPKLKLPHSTLNCTRFSHSYRHIFSLLNPYSPVRPT